MAWTADKKDLEHEKESFSLKTYYYKSCLDIRADIPDSLSGLYSIQPVPGDKVITVYCEMAIAGGGFTFVPRTAIRGIESQQLISALFTNRTQVLMRIQKKDGAQLTPLWNSCLSINSIYWELVSIIMTDTHHQGTVIWGLLVAKIKQGNNYFLAFLSLGILPPDVAGVDGKVLGFQSNGNALRYTNCGGSRNNLFAFLPNHSDLPPSRADVGNYERDGMGS
ncbi:hypothetical protein OS493_013606 [Desmophyllum pertusum]|uniref:Uncharacterized protein n=1 Tax=Desmophyllum pertusum TaxID=174260 RepID=A0A9X0A382_9CNID|nr:hypothetical protein OS493_013606 [Desmophyllum pertusum]